MRKWEAIWRDGVRIVWRSLRWEEYKAFSSRTHHPADLYLEIYKTCILEGPSAEEVPFGVVDWLGLREFEQNPFSGRLSQVNIAINEKRVWLASNYFAACSAILASVLHIPLETIEKMDADEFFFRVAQAEFLIGKPLDPRTKSTKGRHKKPHEPGARDMQFEKSDFTFTK
jgi:hypothetical protein